MTDLMTTTMGMIDAALAKPRAPSPVDDSRQVREARLITFATLALGTLAAHAQIDASESSPSECVLTVGTLLAEARRLDLMEVRR
jgi:hypothetical protein